jgi:TatD DNase family protein
MWLRRQYIKGYNSAMTEFVDIHLHLQDKLYLGQLEEVLGRAAMENVVRMVCNATSQNDWYDVIALADRFKQITPFLGVHPMYLKDRSVDWIDALAAALDKVPAGIGEIGLDRRPNAPDHADQQEVFLAQMKLAALRELPVTIHCVQAWGWMTELIRDLPELPPRMLFHSYAGPTDFIKEFAHTGAYFSFGGVVLDQKHIKSRGALKAVPLDRLVLETDSPDLIAPEPYRKYCLQINERYIRNEPANVPMVYKGVAEILNMDQDELAQKVFENAGRFLAGTGG